MLITERASIFQNPTSFQHALLIPNLIFISETSYHLSAVGSLKTQLSGFQETKWYCTVLLRRSWIRFIS